MPGQSFLPVPYPKDVKGNVEERLRNFYKYKLCTYMLEYCKKHNFFVDGLMWQLQLTYLNDSYSGFSR